MYSFVGEVVYCEERLCVVLWNSQSGSNPSCIYYNVAFLGAADVCCAICSRLHGSLKFHPGDA